MSIIGVISKMKTRLINDKPEYKLPIDDELVLINDYIGKEINLEFLGEIICPSCNIKIKKSYSQGYCYLCSQRLACCDMCILKPEQCHYKDNTCREPKWAKDNCFKEHIIYIANSSGIKVGITRKSNIPSRWIDQGAVQALAILKVKSNDKVARYKSGLIEVQLKKYVSDRTSWQKMLKGEVEDVDLIAKKSELIDNITSEIKAEEAMILNADIVNINYPVLEYPQKVISLNFDKEPNIKGKLLGIKGQYLILNCGVLNIRKFSSYKIAFN